MKKLSLLVASVTILILSFAQAGVAEEISGKALVERDCSSCHGNEMYTRTDLFVKSFRQLEEQVKVWVERSELKWTEDEMDEAIDYLADEFYGFE